MARLSSVYASRAKRAQALPRAIVAAEATLALEGVREEVGNALERSPLPRTGKMLASLSKSIRDAGTRYVIGFDKGKAVYGPSRAAKTGISPSGGHLLDMNPAAGARRKRGEILALRRAAIKAALGPAARSVNGR